MDKLTKKSFNMKKTFIIILCFVILSFLSLCGCKTEQKLQEKQNIEIYDLAYKGDIEGAKEKANEYYINNETKLNAIINKIDSIEEFIDENDIAFPKDNKSSNTIKYEDELVIKDDFNTKIKDGYIYINGSVINQGNKTISYYKIIVKYLDKNNNVIHSNYTNSIENLYPGESREFEIMNKYNGYENYKLLVEEVKY